MGKIKYVSYLIWGIALLSTVISLIFSEILKLPPCSLCWYQRVFMYPLVLIVPVGILKNDRGLFFYAIVLSSVGLLVSTYHSLIYHGIVNETLKLCNAELSCKAKQFELFGLLSIPVMSFFSFLMIFILSVVGEMYDKRN